MSSTRRTTRHLVAATLATFLMLLSANSVLAEDVTVTFDVTAAAGGLSAASGSASADIGDSPYAGGSAHTITANMPALTVTDDRGLLTAWSVTVSGTDWSDGGSNSVTADNGVVYFGAADAAALVLASTVNNMTVTACACAADGATALAANDLATPYELAAGIGTSLVSTPSVTMTPSIHVSIPGVTPQATYSNTVTYTVS